MKKVVFLLLVAVVFTGCTENSKKTTVAQALPENGKVLRHVVLFKFNENASPDTIKTLEKKFNALSNSIKEIKAFEWGLNNSPEGLNKGFTHCFLATFDNEAGLAVYLPHPDHQAFVAELKPHLEDLLVLDYWTE